MTPHDVGWFVRLIQAEIRRTKKRYSPEYGMYGYETTLTTGRIQGLEALLARVKSRKVKR